METGPPLRRGTTTRLDSLPTRPVCKFGAKCYRANPAHLEEMCHPFDDDYLVSCRKCKITPDLVSIRKVFEWADTNGSGKVPQESFEAIWPIIVRLGKDVPPLNDDLWAELDDDGNGYLSFGEFAEYTTKKEVALPLGMDSLMGGSNQKANLTCGVIDCSCKAFKQRRRRCKYNEGCYNKDPAHLADFSHPGDDDYEKSKERGDMEMCVCGHKKRLHASPVSIRETASYPAYWEKALREDGEFNTRVKLDADEIGKFQELLSLTYKDITTRDRANHNKGCWMVPRDFTVESVMRNENSLLWRKYSMRKAVLRKERERAEERERSIDAPVELSDVPPQPYIVYEDVESTRVWEAMDAEPLDHSINEWYLFHGTSNSAALNICEKDFKLSTSFAGKNTGTLYGRGSYLAESITKADEYSKGEGSPPTFTVLLCRVLGGRVNYTDERTPNTETLVANCLEGIFDSILGDRAKSSKTYREFVIFDTENVYPEYIIKYRRGELFKSKSHP